MNASPLPVRCSVVICTRNRAAQLKDVLTSIQGLFIPSGLSWELIVVDNASTDDTAATIDAFHSNLPLRRVTERRLGLSNARNAGVRATRGHYIIWTDDDVRVDRQWLSAYLDSFTAWPDAVVFGGKVTPDLMAPSPAWFRDSSQDLTALLAHRDFGPDEKPLCLEHGEYPYGANFAIRGAEQRKCLYDPDLGVAPGRRTGGEEFDVIQRVALSPGACRWVPKAEVKHLIPAHRQTLSYIFSYYASEGEVWITRNQNTLTVFGIPGFSFYKMPVSAIRFSLAHLLGMRSMARHAKRLAWHRGVLQRSFVRRWQRPQAKEP